MLQNALTINRKCVVIICIYMVAGCNLYCTNSVILGVAVLANWVLNQTELNCRDVYNLYQLLNYCRNKYRNLAKLSCLT